MDVAILIVLGVTWGVIVLIVQRIRSLGDRAVVVEAVQELCRRLVHEEASKVIKAFKEVELEWESTYAKFSRLLGRATRFKQEDMGLHKGGPNAGVPEAKLLTRADLKAMLATGSWRTSSTPPLEKHLPESPAES